jgi:hypothetical protein
LGGAVVLVPPPEPQPKSSLPFVFDQILNPQHSKEVVEGLKKK